MREIELFVCSKKKKETLLFKIEEKNQYENSIREIYRCMFCEILMLLIINYYDEKNTRRRREKMKSVTVIVIL